MWHGGAIELSPRYGSDPLLTLDGAADSVGEPAIRQRRRLAATLASFTDEQWAAPSRCEGWSSRDVVAHLDSTNAFWTLSVEAGLRGEPTRFLTTFDPVATPAQLVEATRPLPTAEVLDRFVASNEKLVGLLGSLDDAGWSALAEAPPGHVSVSAVVHHALWDSWVHERDVLLPLGLAPPEEADEVAACLRYAAVLGPAFAVSTGEGRTGALAVAAHDPDVAFVVEVGDRITLREVPAGAVPDADVTLTGDAVELIEALSLRRPLDQPVPAEASWLIAGLAAAYDA